MTTTIKQGSCPLISVKSNGQIQYRITTDATHQRYVQLLAATSGGCLSPDKIAEQNITKVLRSISDDAHFSSTLFNPLFKGKSANNAGFLAAVLRAEGVITQSKNHTYKHRTLNIDAISLLKPVK